MRHAPTRRSRSTDRVTVIQMTTVPQSLAFLAGQTRYLRQCGFDVTVVTSPGTEVAPFERREGVEVIQIPMQRRIRPIADLGSLLRLVVLFRRMRPDLVHAHTPKAALLGMMAAWVVRVPARVFHVHGLPVSTARGARRWLLSLTDGLTAALANDVLFVSESLRQDAVARKMCPSSKTRVLGSGSANGIDAEVRFNPELLADAGAAAKRGLGIPEASQVVGFVGRLVVDKGVVDLLNAWTQLEARYPDARLLVVGPEEDADSISDDAKSRIRSDSSIVWVPWTDHPEVLLSFMNVVAIPSYREGLNLSLLEASAMAKPAVSCDLPGMRDAVVDGVTGTLIEKGDVNALVRAVGAYLDDDRLARAHGTAGRQRVLNDFVPRRLWKELAATYAALTPRGGAPSSSVAGPT